MASSLDGVSHACFCAHCRFSPTSVRAGDDFSVVRYVGMKEAVEERYFAGQEWMVNY